MNGRTHTLAYAMKLLTAKGCEFNSIRRVISIPPKAEIGNKTWGVLSFMRKTEGYRWIWERS